MTYYLQEKYVNPLTDFGFKRLFGTEPNKALLVDFLNTLLPPEHQIQELTYRSTENFGNTSLERKAIFDIYCQSEKGEKFIVEIQKVKQNYFKDRSLYYATFPIQEQAQKGYWDYKLKAVYCIGVLDFIFDDHKNDENFLQVVQLKNQYGEVFYEKLKFIHLELPKFTKSLEELETHLDKWLYLLRYLPDLSKRPELLQESIFAQLFEVAKIANFSPGERSRYESSLKSFRDMNNVVNTSREEGREEGLQVGLARGREEGARTLVLRLLARRFGELPDSILEAIARLSEEQLEALSEALFELSTQEELQVWLEGLGGNESEESANRS